MNKIQCPKCGYIRKHAEIVPDYECPKCGIIYSKVNTKKEIPKVETIDNAQLNNINMENNNLTSDKRINDQLHDLGEFDMWFTKKEIQFLPDVIRKDELIKGLASGIVDNNTWLIVVTNQRILFLDKGMIYGLKQLEMHYEQISAVSHSTGLLLAKITISTSGGSKTISGIQNKDAPKISQLISDLIRKSKGQTNVQRKNNIDVVSQLERLSSLLEKGILTEEEFENQKRKILSV